MITIINHPLVHRDLRILRDKASSTADYRAASYRIGLHLAMIATQDLQLSESSVDTPMETTDAFVLKNNVILMPVLRAGLAMVGPFTEILPDARYGYIGLKRDEVTLQPNEYYFSLPPYNENTVVFLLDVMLATGGSLCSTLSRLQLEGISNIRIVTMISAPEGIEQVSSEYPQFPIYMAALDRCLDANGYILPGLGDAGDRFTAF